MSLLCWLTKTHRPYGSAYQLTLPDGAWVCACRRCYMPIDLRTGKVVR